MRKILFALGVVLAAGLLIGVAMAGGHPSSPTFGPAPGSETSGGSKGVGAPPPPAAGDNETGDADLYVAAVVSEGASLVHYYRFDEASGTTLNDYDSPAVDGTIGAAVLFGQSAIFSPGGLGLQTPGENGSTGLITIPWDALDTNVGSDEFCIEIVAGLGSSEPGEDVTIMELDSATTDANYKCWYSAADNHFKWRLTNDAGTVSTGNGATTTDATVFGLTINKSATRGRMNLGWSGAAGNAGSGSGPWATPSGSYTFTSGDVIKLGEPTNAQSVVFDFFAVYSDSEKYPNVGTHFSATQ